MITREDLYLIFLAYAQITELIKFVANMLEV